MITNAGRAVMLDALDLDTLRAHSAYPGHTGANQIASAEVDATFDAASGTPPTRALNAAVQIPIGAGQTARWITAWTALGSPSTCVAVSPNGGDPKEFIVDVTNDKILEPGHTRADGDKVVFYGGDPPGGLTEGTVYFVRDQASGEFKVAATAGGSAINLTSQAAAACVVSKIVEETFASSGSLNVATFPVGANF